MLIVTRQTDVDILQMLYSNGYMANIRLYVNPFDVDSLTVRSDLTECTSPWYTSRNPTWGPPFVNTAGKGQINASSITWVTGAPEATIIYGSFWTDSGSGALRFIDPFDEPIFLTRVGIPIVYQPILTASEAPPDDV